MSDNERPDLAAFQELEQLIRVLGDEMAAWRRRAHEAEARTRELEARLAREAGSSAAAVPRAAPEFAAGGVGGGANAELIRENQELRMRLEAARQRTKLLLDRLRFLRQQHELGAER